MTERDLYKGPPKNVPEIPQEKPVDYTATEQAQGFGIPAEELEPKAELVPPAGMPPSFWKSLGVGS